ncbi:MAG: type I-C CRISPR-associated protein Cas8c/Csd1 [Planctomycetes bacterium GWF2_41_51]|nr:MAG: type I-C CRISPR-associated protein Cas8c/Csd1 [Planctomycetes bacterium GWF2_41_51]HBG27722.1 type I-C CRISPR-associated protein Cas8c/Csd1 [Phycisphaerales bacterium]
MIKELSELGKIRRETRSDALKKEMVSLCITIDTSGKFLSYTESDKETIAESIQRTRNPKARTLIDKAEYILGYGKESEEKHKLFLDELGKYSDLPEVKPVWSFYNGNRAKGIEIAIQNYKSSWHGNIAFLVLGNTKMVHEEPAVQNRIIENYDNALNEEKINETCSICGSKNFPIIDIHEKIKGVPPYDDGKSSARALISYNDNAYESYNLKKNQNSFICSKCAKNYTEGLNWLLSNKIGDKPSNRKNFGSDTTMVFWTREDTKVNEMSLLDTPDPQEITNLIDSVAKGNDKSSKYLNTDQFYSCTLSGSAARISVRDWIETSLTDFRINIAKWFRDIAINAFKQTYYPSLYDLARSCQNKKEDKKEITLSRVAGHLWDCAIKNNPPPIWILTSVLKRARLDKRGVTPERAALIKLILNRNNNGGSFMVQENLSQDGRPVAYVCGQIFAKMESIQYAAHGELNAGIREKYFTYSMTLPAAALGRLFNINSKHFTKLKGDKPGLAVVLDKELQELCKDIRIQELPQTFSLEEQGQFAIGYYHQKQSQFNNLKQK